ncbi:MAG: cell division protein SepF [Myxococcales bacterium]|nr:cell division protein SepF [Myxococcales bacterium]
MEGYADSERILNKLREGNILLVKIKSLREKDETEFKRSMERMKKTCSTINGDIGSLGNDWLLLTPSFAKIHKS